MIGWMIGLAVGCCGCSRMDDWMTEFWQDDVMDGLSMDGSLFIVYGHCPWSYAYILKADVLDVRTPQKIKIFRRKIV